MAKYEKNWKLPAGITDMLNNCAGVKYPSSREELIELSLNRGQEFEVSFDVPGKGRTVEASVVRCKNGAAVNYTEPYMRRRDPECVYVGDMQYSDKPKFSEKYGRDFEAMRNETLDWLKSQELIVMPFTTGNGEVKYESLFIGPANCAFFSLAVADLQQMMPADSVAENYEPKILLVLAPVFRHTVFNGRQAVVHNRQEGCYEIFSYNLYPGPSAKKGLYGALLHYGEKEGWLTLHSSVTKMVTPYENEIVILHEGASGGGKSEMNEHMEHSDNNTMIIGKNTVTGEVLEKKMFVECGIKPVSDDMTLCHTSIQKNNGRITVLDAEKAWFVRVDHLKHYGTNPVFEKMCIHPSEPILFLNIEAKPGATCLIWEHTQDAPGKPCPNPRVIFPRRLVPGVINDPLEVDYRSFGVRTPPCSKEKPTYGIIGFFHILPPALAWLWRLASPRGHDNPSIIDKGGMTSEGIGTYGPFLTGSSVKQANILLEQILGNPGTQYVLFPNQYSGAWKTGFMPQWLIREYLARRGARKFESKELNEAGCSLLGYTRRQVKIEDTELPDYLLDVRLQPEVGEEAYLKGAAILKKFFENTIKPYEAGGLSKEALKVIECFRSGGTVHDYEKLGG